MFITEVLMNSRCDCKADRCDIPVVSKEYYLEALIKRQLRVIQTVLEDPKYFTLRYEIMKKEDRHLPMKDNLRLIWIAGYEILPTVQSQKFAQHRISSFHVTWQHNLHFI